MPPRRESSRSFIAGRRRVALALLFVGAALVGPAAARATEPPPAPAAPGAKTGSPAKAPTPLPPARPVDDIIRDVVTALGGAQAIAKHHSEHTKMTITFQGLGITGSAEHWG